MSLIDNIYDAIDDDEIYRQVPKIVADAVGARSSMFKLLSRSYEVEDITTHCWNDENLSFYVQHAFHRSDEWALVMDRLPNGRGHALRIGDFQSADVFHSSFFYNDLLKQFGDDSYHCLAFTDVRPDGGLVIMGVQRASRAE